MHMCMYTYTYVNARTRPEPLGHYQHQGGGILSLRRRHHASDSGRWANVETFGLGFGVQGF